MIISQCRLESFFFAFFRFADCFFSPTDFCFSSVSACRRCGFDHYVYMCTDKITATRDTTAFRFARQPARIYIELFTSAHSKQSELPCMPLHACMFHSLCQRPSARSRIVLPKRPSARLRIVLPQASICKVADSACGLTLCDYQIHAVAETCNLRVSLAIAVGLVSC